MSVHSDRMKNVEEQICPDREGSPFSFPLPDYWQLGRWAGTQEEAAAEVAEFMQNNPNGGMGNVLWLYPGNQPKTCSYCGGGYPDDLIELVKVGWEVGSTGKTYKRYLQPPGYHAYMKDLLEHKSTKPQYPSPIPPVKLYLWHFSEEQIRFFNLALVRA